MTEHYCEEIGPDDEGWNFARCNCGYQTEPAPDLDIVVDMMMDHAMKQMQIFMIGNRVDEK